MRFVPLDRLSIALPSPVVSFSDGSLALRGAPNCGRLHTFVQSLNQPDAFFEPVAHKQLPSTVSNERRCFPPPWSIEHKDSYFIMRDDNGQALVDTAILIPP